MQRKIGPVTMAARALAPFVAAVEASGLDPRGLFERAGVDPSLVERFDARLPRDVVYAFVEDAVAITGDDDLGIHAAELAVATPGMYGVVEFLARSSRTVRECVETVTRFVRVMKDDTALELTVHDGIAAATLVATDGVIAPRAWSDLLVVGTSLYARRFVTVPGGTRAASLCVRVPHAEPAHLEELRRQFDCPIEFGSLACSVLFRADVLDCPIVTADPALASVLAPYAEQLLETHPDAREGSVRRISQPPIAFASRESRPPLGSATRESQPPLARESQPPGPALLGRVRALLTEELESGAPTADRIAERLGMSVRTLCRRLSAEGTSFQNALDGLRHDLALDHLRAATPIGDIAGLLGFSSTSAFHHAFRRWTGVAPSDWRARRADARV